MSRLRDAQTGAAIVEMAFVTVLLAILACGVADLGRAIFTNIGVQDAAQEGARYAAYNPPTDGTTETNVKLRTIQATEYPTLSVDDVDVLCRDTATVEVEVTSTMTYITPLIGGLFGGSIDLSHSYTSRVLTQDDLCAL